MRRAAKRDANEPEIIAALEGIGATVEQLSAKGVPDLAVRYRDRWVFLECKSPGGRLTTGQIAFMAKHGTDSFRIVTTPDEALSAIKEA